MLLLEKELINFEEIEPHLVQFSEFKIYDKENKQISYLDARKELEKIKEAKKKENITAFLIFKGQIIERIDTSLGNLDYFEKIYKDKENLRLVIYNFKDEAKYKKFLSNSKIDEYDNILISFRKKIIKNYFRISLFILLITTFIVYNIFIDFAIPFDSTIDLIFLFKSEIFIVLFLYLFVPILLPMICIRCTFPFLLSMIIYWIMNIFNVSMPINILVTLFSFFIFYYLIDKKYIKFSYINKIYSYVLVFGLSPFIGLVLISSTYLNDTKVNLVINPYQKVYGYPKIIEKDNKEYYIVAKGKYNYLGYDIEEHKCKFITLKYKDNKNFEDSNMPLSDFITDDNSEITSLYMKPQLNIKDKNITILNSDLFKKIKFTKDDCLDSKESGDANATTISIKE